MRILCLLCFLVLSSSAMSQVTNGDGLFLPIKEKKCSAQEIQFRKKKYCVPEKPILAIKHFARITELKQAGKTSFFDVYLDKQATQKLNLAQTKLHRVKFALILNNQMKGWVELDSDVEVSQLRFYSTSFGSAIVEVQQYLESVISTEKEE